MQKFGKKQEKCRFLYLVGQLRAGGLERQLVYLLQTLDQKSYFPKVIVWNFNENDFYVPKILDLGVEVLPLPRGLGPIGKLLAFLKIVRDLNPEVIHSYSFYTNFPAYLGEFVSNAVAIGAMRSDFTNEVKMAGFFLGRLCARWPNVHISNNVRAGEEIKKRRGPFLPQNLYIVRNGLSLKKFNVQELPISPKGQILAIGSLLPVKRWDRLLETATELKRRGHKFLIRLVGDGPLREDLVQKSRALGVFDCIEFLGHCDNIPELLASSHFLVHTSDREGCPNVIMEAMACGRAVVATDTGDIPLLVDQGETGFVISGEDPSAFWERMECLLNDYELCRKMGQVARIKAEEKFGLDRLFLETTTAYRAAGWKGY
ncbi:MAG: glycosyltransferase family 4 protein [Nitrospira sp.]|nr:glycosyltransferase family 4 protein [Nitrospira sp.]